MSDSERLHDRVIQAFVDRAPIDWTAITQRLSSDRGEIENLRLLHAIRPGAGPTHEQRRSAPRFFAMIVVALATVQGAVVLCALGDALARGEMPIARGPQAIVASGFWIASLLLASKARRDSRTLFLLAWFTSAGTAFGRHILTGLPARPAGIPGQTLWSVLPEAFMPACVWELSLVFPRVRRFARFDQVGRRLAIGAWILGALLFTANLPSAYDRIDDGKLALLVLGTPQSLFWRIILVAVAPAVIAIFVRARRAPPTERRTVLRLAGIIAVGAAPMVLLGIAVSIVPAANRWMLTVSPAERLWLDVAVLASLAITPLLATVAVFVDRPFELHALLRPTSTHALLRGFLSALTLVPFVLLAATLYTQRHGSLAEVFSGAAAPLLMAYTTIGCVLLALRTRLARALDRLFSQRSMDHHRRLAQGLERIRLARGRREIAAVLERELRRGTGASAVVVLSRDRSGHFAAPSRRIDSLPTDSALATVLTEATGPLDVSNGSELMALLPHRDRDWCISNDVGLIVALRHRDEEIAAVVAIGPKRRALPFDDRDAWLIGALTTATAAVWNDTDDRKPQDADRTLEGGRDLWREIAFECPLCGAVTSSVVPTCACGVSLVLGAVPARLGETFLVQQRLGAGGMGIVYLAHDVTLGREVALKTLPRLAVGAVARLRDEARAMATLNHPSLATIYGMEVWRRTPVLIVEYFPQGTLAQRLARGTLSVTDTMSLGVVLARALVYMHARGVLHRDIKPSNIGFTAAGSPKLLDFGLALVIESTTIGDDGVEATVRPAVRAGTPAYLPPEAFDEAPPTVHFDLWGLSVVLKEALTGVKAPVADPHLEFVAPALSRVLERALDPRPERRFQSAAELLAALEA